MRTHWLLGIYPKAWRDRYGEELRDTLDRQRLSPGIVLDVLAGALDAHLHPELLPHRSEDKEAAMALMTQCWTGPDKPLDRRTIFTAGAAAVIITIVVAAGYRVVGRIWGDTLSAHVLQSSAVPAGLSVWFQLTRYKEVSATSRLIVGAGFFLLMFGVTFGLTYGGPR
jgi:hypothetical protein